MAISGRFCAKNVLFLGLALFSCVVVESTTDNGNGAVRGRRVLAEAAGAPGKVFDITQFGAKGDGTTDCTMAFMKAWTEACRNSVEPANILVPPGDFLTAPLIFQGPCNSTQTITVEVKGNVVASEDLSQYSEDSWILFEFVDGLVLTGGGTFDGRGKSAWPYNNCKPTSTDCNRLPSSIKMRRVTNAVIDGIKSLDSKYFHFHVTDCSGITATNLNIIAPEESPNTDGIHFSDTDTISVTNSIIGTGDDCISIGQGVTNINVSQVVCGPGHGISVGSLGKYKNEKDVGGITVTNCTIKNTTNGARIKSYAGSPPSKATSIIFQDIIMDAVKNPIIIDQKYGNRNGPPSNVKISDVHFRNIKGSSMSNVAVSLLCSEAAPCEGVELVDIDLTLKPNPEAKGDTLSSSCLNTKVVTSGVQNPPPCA